MNLDLGACKSVKFQMLKNQRWLRACNEPWSTKNKSYTREFKLEVVKFYCENNLYQTAKKRWWPRTTLYFKIELKSLMLVIFLIHTQVTIDCLASYVLRCTLAIIRSCAQIFVGIASLISEAMDMCLYKYKRISFIRRILPFHLPHALNNQSTTTGSQLTVLWFTVQLSACFGWTSTHHVPPVV